MYRLRTLRARTEVVSLQRAIGLRVWPHRRRIHQQHRRRLQPHSLEHALPVHEVQRPEKHARRAASVPFQPGLREQVPFRLELAAHLAAEAGFERGEEDGGGVVARLGVLVVVGERREERAYGAGELGEGGFVEGYWARARLRFEVVGLEDVGAGFG